MKELSQEELATNAHTYGHIENVMKLLARMQLELSKRMFTHDRSKLEQPEVSMFTKFTSSLQGLTYGSPEYQEQLELMKRDALGHHYENNRHHPEFFPEPEPTLQIQELQQLLSRIEDLSAANQFFGQEMLSLQTGLTLLIHTQLDEMSSRVNQMNLIDLIEMLCDWKAATMRHTDGDIRKSLEINKGRFQISYQLQRILENTIPLLEPDPCMDRATQKGL